MSTDYYFRHIRPVTEDIPFEVEASEYVGKYEIVPESCAEEYHKRMGVHCKAKRRALDIFSALTDYLGEKVTAYSYVDGVYRCYNGAGVSVGFVTASDLEKYRYDKIEDSYLCNITDIGFVPDYEMYGIFMKDGAYTPGDLLSLARHLVTQDTGVVMYSAQDALWVIMSAYFAQSDGGEIFVEKG